MKKIISGIFASALSVVVLAWAYDAMGSVGHEGGGHHETTAAAAERAAETEHAAGAGHAGEAEHAGSGPASELNDALDDDFADDDVARTRLSRRALDRIELTDDQREKIDALRSAYARDIIQLRADTRLARVDLREVMNETSPDVSRVRELAAAVSRAQGSMFERSAVMQAELKNMLTPEQQETLRESFRDRRDGRRDSGMRWRRGGRDSRGRR